MVKLPAGGGLYAIENVLAGEYEARARAFGYLPNEPALLIVSDGKRRNKAQALEPQEVIRAGHRFQEKLHHSASVGRFDCSSLPQFVGGPSMAAQFFDSRSIGCVDGSGD